MTASPAVADRITELMLGGYSIDFACEKGVAGGWTRADVLEVVRAKGWNLDASGRLPFRDRPPRPRATVQPQRRRTDRPIPAVGPVPVPSLPAALEAIDQWAQGGATPAPAELERQLDAPTVVAPVHCDHAAGVCGDRAHQALGGQADRDWFAANRRQVGANLARADDTQTPTEGTAPGTIGADAAGTAPDPSGSGHGYAGPDAQPQVSPSRSHSGEGGGPGASDAPTGPPAADVEAHADRPLADWELELLAPTVSPDDWVWDETAKCYELRSEQTTPEPASDQVENFRNARPVDVLAAGLAHPHPAVRAKAKRLQRAVDELCTALSRSGRPC